MNLKYIEQMSILAEVSQHKEKKLYSIPDQWFVPGTCSSPLKGGTIIMAGGESTRFGSLKALYPICPSSNRSTLELMISKAFLKGPVAVMGSVKNRDQLAPYLNNASYFEQQEEWPFLYEGKGWIKEKEDWKKGPVGNGVVFEEFARSGLVQKWQEEGIDYVEVMAADNPLLTPHDPELLYCMHKGHDLAIKVVEKNDPNASVGLVGECNGRLHVAEYVECSGAGWGYAGVCALPLEKLIELSNESLPWHVVEKKDHYRFEKWIIDFFPKANNPAVSILDKAQFHPLKTKQEITKTREALLGAKT